MLYTIRDEGMYPASDFSTDSEFLNLSESDHEVNRIKGYSKVNIDNIDVFSFPQELQHLIIMGDKLTETGMAMTKAMLAWIEEVIPFHLRYNGSPYYLLKHLDKV